MILDYRGYTIIYSGYQNLASIMQNNLVCERVWMHSGFTEHLQEARTKIDEWIANEEQAQHVWDALEELK